MPTDFIVTCSLKNGIRFIIHDQPTDWMPSSYGHRGEYRGAGRMYCVSTPEIAVGLNDYPGVSVYLAAHVTQLGSLGKTSTLTKKSHAQLIDIHRKALCIMLNHARHNNVNFSLRPER